MNNPRLAIAVFALVAVAGLVIFALLFPDLPSTVATRYASDGTVEKEASKALFAAMFGGVLLLGGLYCLAAYRSLGKLPEKYLRIVPDHTYWLAPERRTQSLRSLSAMFVWLAVLTVALFTATFSLIMLANTGQLDPSTQSTIGNALDTVYLTLLFAGAIGFRRRFRPPPQKAAEPAKPEDDSSAS